MRRDTQIGIILGVVILVVIGVFLSTRTTVKETEIPNLILSEEGTAESEIEEIEEIDISELIKKTKTEIAKEVSPVEDAVEEVQTKEELAKTTPEEKSSEESPVVSSKDDTTLEGKWEGTETTSIKPVETISEPPIAEVITEETEVVKQTLSNDKGKIAEKKPRISSVSYTGKVIHKVQSNDNLFNISREYYGDETKWNEIYEANKGKMRDPDALYIGQELLIPEIALTENETKAIEASPDKKPEEVLSVNTGTHTVKSGDTLYGLAKKYYGDSAMWNIIYEANENSIEDKRLLKTGQILIIPE